MKDSNQNNQNSSRSRTKSTAENNFFSNDEVSIEDLTVLKLMEEIMEIDQEIKLKRKFINTRMKMLHKLLPSHPNKQTALYAEDFLLNIQSEYVTNSKQVTYDSSQSAIPLRQADVYPNPIELKDGDVYESPI